MAFGALEEILEQCSREGEPFWRVVLKDDINERNVTEEESIRQMEELWDAMLLAAALYDKKLNSHSGLTGGDGGRMEAYVQKGDTLSGPFIGQVIAGALQMGESNACMHRIVAAPTAGSCGVIPAVFLVVEERLSLPEEKMVEAMFVSAGIGAVIAENASLAGASGGCQAEIGSASAMAAGGLAYLQGGSAEQIADAAAFALKNMLGLACDPVGGLVEVPCIKRNVAGAVNALTSAQLAMAGITSAIPVDEVIDAMRRIGNEMPSAIKETSLGGLATSPTAVRLTEK